jgi:four helix bundle protein
MNSYKDLMIYKDALRLFLRIHPLSLHLPKFETYELGSQVRRSADGVISNIVEGYGRKRYKQDFIRFLSYAHASNLETINHLEKVMLLYPQYSTDLRGLMDEYTILGMKIFRFIQYVEKSWRV